MTSIREYSCEICGTFSKNPTHWFVIQCGNVELTVIKWNSEAANAKGARHYCGEAHAQVYISRWWSRRALHPSRIFWERQWPGPGRIDEAVFSHRSYESERCQTRPNRAATRTMKRGWTQLG